MLEVLFTVFFAGLAAVLTLPRISGSFFRIRSFARACGLKKTVLPPGTGRWGAQGRYKDLNVKISQILHITDDTATEATLPLLRMEVTISDPRLRSLSMNGAALESRMDQSVVHHAGLSDQPFVTDAWGEAQTSNRIRALLTPEARQRLSLLVDQSFKKNFKIEPEGLIMLVDDSRFATVGGMIRLLDHMIELPSLLGSTDNVFETLIHNYRSTKNPVLKMNYLDSLHAFMLTNPTLVLSPDLLQEAHASRFAPLEFKAVQIAGQVEHKRLPDILAKADNNTQGSILEYLARCRDKELFPFIRERQKSIKGSSRLKLAGYVLAAGGEDAEQFFLAELTDDIPDDSIWVDACLKALETCGTLAAVPVLYRYRRLGMNRQVDRTVKAIQSRHAGGAEGWLSMGGESHAAEGAVSLETPCTSTGKETEHD